MCFKPWALMVVVMPFSYNSFYSSGKAFHLMLECCSRCGRDLLPFRHNDSQSAFQFISKVFSGLCRHQTLSKPFLNGLPFCTGGIITLKQKRFYKIMFAILQKKEIQFVDFIAVCLILCTC